MQGMTEHIVDLRGGGPAEGQRRQRGRAEKNAASLVSSLGRAEPPVISQMKKHLVDAIENPRRMSAPLVISHGGKLERFGLEPGFFGDFPHHAFGRRLMNVGPAARQRSICRR